ncbi:restriction endonuclease subunit S [Marinifilum fragile]|uniref:restriction endonuclease subunit S n=1 Tax=Marinifilum fragile TaxID=570161 RepID=UPI002AA84288|nr:restriction endonuclease subunit S [Marinifilum fragile]
MLENIKSQKSSKSNESVVQTMSLQAYKKYQPVEYDYISQLPEDWQLLPNIAIFQERIERGHEDKELLSVTIGRGVIKQSELDKKDSSTLDKSKYLLVYPGDLVYSMRFRQGASGYSVYKGIVSPACTVLKPKKGVELNPRFFYYMFRTGFYKNYVERFAYGIADGQIPLRYVDFKRMYSIVPPLETQNNIVAYLDRKTQQIQEFIAKKERLIELLEERRKSEIQKLITKGTVPNVELINTNIKWFSTMPKHWVLKKLKHFANHVQRGSSPDYVIENGIPVVSQAVFSAGFIDESKFKFQKKQKIESFKGQLFNNDVLVASTGGGVLGKSFLFELHGDYIADGHVTLIRDSKKRFVPAFLNFILSINFNLIEGYLGQGSTNQTELQREWFRNMLFPFPPIEEQEEIVNTIRKINDEIDRIISKAQTEIEKAKEYQESLITQVVTGQLKVPMSELGLK